MASDFPKMSKKASTNLTIKVPQKQQIILSLDIEAIERQCLSVLENATIMAALYAAPARGRDNRKFADGLAVNGMRKILNEKLPIPAEVVIGEGERDEAPMLYIGEQLGPQTQNQPKLLIAVDPLEGTNLCARYESNAICIIAAAIEGEGFLLGGIDGYMNKFVIGQALCKKIIKNNRTNFLDLPIETVIKKIAAAQNKPVDNVVVMILERNRNADLSNRLKAMHVQVRPIRDGDITAGLLALDSEQDVDLAIGIGAAPEGVITAAMANVMGGYMEARWWFPDNEKGKKQRQRLLVKNIDIKKLYRINDLASGNVMFSLTAVTGNDFMPGVIYKPDGVAITHTISARSRTCSLNIQKTFHPTPPPPPKEYPNTTDND